MNLAQRSIIIKQAERHNFMWRTIPLAKVLLRMVVFGALLGAVLGLLSIIAFESRIPAPKSYFHPQIILGGVMDGVILGGLVGVALALYAAVAHRTIHKPLHFRFATQIVATIVTLAVVQQPFHIVTLNEVGISLGDWIRWAFSGENMWLILFFATIAKHVAIGLMSLFVAGRYLRESSARYMKATGQDHSRSASGP